MIATWISNLICGSIWLVWLIRSRDRDAADLLAEASVFLLGLDPTARVEYERWVLDCRCCVLHRIRLCYSEANVRQTAIADGHDPEKTLTLLRDIARRAHAFGGGANAQEGYYA